MGLVKAITGGSSDDLQFIKKDPAPQPDVKADAKPSKDKPPKGAGKSSAPTVKKTATSGELKKIEDALVDFLGMPAMACDFRGDEWPAEHIRSRSPELAKRITKIAEQKPEFREQLLKLIEGGVWGPLLFAGIMYILPLGVYYELVPLPMPARMALAGGTPIRSEMMDVEREPVEDPFEREARERAGE